jgi:uncharacterized protein YicC (UPF0701 family)
MKNFEEESEDMTTLMKQQLSIIKSSLETVNSTISDMEYNNDAIKHGVEKLKAYMEKFASESERHLDILDIKITVEGHIARVNHALDAILRNLDLTTECLERTKGHNSTSDNFTEAPYGDTEEKCSYVSKGYHGTLYFKQRLQ